MGAHPSAQDAGSDLLGLKEWVQTELWLFAAEQADDGFINRPALRLSDA